MAELKVFNKYTNEYEVFKGETLNKAFGLFLNNLDIDFEVTEL